MNPNPQSIRAGLLAPGMITLVAHSDPWVLAATPEPGHAVPVYIVSVTPNVVHATTRGGRRYYPRYTRVLFRHVITTDPELKLGTEGRFSIPDPSLRAWLPLNMPQWEGHITSSTLEFAA